MLNTCFSLCICGGMVLHSTCTNAAYQLTLVLASVTNSLIAMSMMRRDSLDDNDFVRKANGGLHGQAAMSLLLQCSRPRRHTELAYLFFTHCRLPPTGKSFSTHG